MKICPVGVELFHAEGRTDITKLMVAFRIFANAPKNLHKFVKYLEYLFINWHLQITIPYLTQSYF